LMICGLRECPKWVKFRSMKLRFDLVEKLTPEMIMESALANQHRYKAEPVLSKTGVGYLAPRTPEDSAEETALGEALVKKLKRRLRKNGKNMARPN
jgi:hypothetical protein